MHALLLDNRDSFVWNLAQMAMELGASVEVVRSDRTGVEAVAAIRPDAILISPGPGRPEDAGCSVTVIRELGGHIPILGVCLGHQALGLAYGARIDRTTPCHGKTRAIHHDDAGLFRDLPSRFMVCRYHSLCVARDSIPPDLEVDAWSEDGVVMALRHRTLPLYGVQFHPESFRTELGAQLVGAFLRVAG